MNINKILGWYLWIALLGSATITLCFDESKPVFRQAGWLPWLFGRLM